MKKESIFEQEKSTRGRHCSGEADRFGDEKVHLKVLLFDFACLLVVVVAKSRFGAILDLMEFEMFRFNRTVSQGCT